jgi:hypothetical protein
MSRDSTPSETAPNRADSRSTAASRIPGRAALVVVVLLSLFAVGPAAVQSNADRSADNLLGMTEGLF